MQSKQYLFSSWSLTVSYFRNLIIERNQRIPNSKITTYMVYKIASSVLHLLPILPVYISQMIAKIVDRDQGMRTLQFIF